MSNYAIIIHHATSVLCRYKGSMILRQLHMKVSERFDITEEDFWHLVNKCPRFKIVRNTEQMTDEWGTDCIIVAKTSLRLCRQYLFRQPCSNCPKLHLCNHFVYGNCRFGRMRKPCKFSHDMNSAHNYPLLRECTLHELREEDLFFLLLQNQHGLLPKVCSKYNKGAPRGGDSCTFGDSCDRVHLCKHFVQGDCIWGHKCKRQHVISQHGRRMLERKGISGDVVNDLPIIYQNIHLLTTLLPPRKSNEQKAKDTNEICRHFLTNTCRFLDQCIQVHFNLPYKWEVFEGSCWKELEHMEEIERAYCDPRNTHSPGPQPVDFLTMTRESEQVRRLSTLSFVKRKPGFKFLLTTEWVWYYKGDNDNWVEYGQPEDDNQRVTTVTSQDLEEAYLADSSAEVTVMKGHRHYYLSFQDMYQRNPKHNTKKRVRRRPRRFVSTAEVHQIQSKAAGKGVGKKDEEQTDVLLSE